MTLSPEARSAIADICKFDYERISDKQLAKSVEELGRRDWIYVASRFLTTIMSEAESDSTSKYGRIMIELVEQHSTLRHIFVIEDSVVNHCIDENDIESAWKLIQLWNGEKPIA